ncbi:MAG: FtsW/RodA/SpoVE family cell cycle protein [Tannerella sp.]|jgi:cell division protein FtsW|nr:FtsW/RodA/SpoVE family cell cycle protein [Tannerella sp.]
MEATNPKKKVFCGDMAIWRLFFCLTFFSLVGVFSATNTLAYQSENILDPFARHATFLLGGALLVLGLAHTPYKYFKLAIILLPVSIALLVYAACKGININKAARWISLFGVEFQPSEFGKLACVIFVAFWLSMRRLFPERIIYKIILWGVGSTFFLIMIYNLSTAILLCAVSFLMLIIGQISIARLLKLLCVLAILGTAVICMPEKTVQEYLPRASTWQSRIKQWLIPDNETVQSSDEDYQITLSKAAIASGGLLGKGPGGGEQRNYLPQIFTDFIYAAIIEDWGILFGGLGVFLLYVILMIRTGIIARKCDKLFPRYLVIGCGLMISMQAFIHMAVNLDLFPVTGLPLPLISRGGTSTILTCAYIGIILSVSHFGVNEKNTDESKEESIATV